MDRRYSFSLRRSSISCFIPASIAWCGSICSLGLLVIRFARVAYMSVLSVSSLCVLAGDTHATMRHSAEPPIESISSFVSFESRYGTWTFVLSPCTDREA